MSVIISPDKNGIVDQVVVTILDQIDTDIPLVPITRTENFQFNPELLKLDRYILSDYVEYGWNWDRKQTHVFGVNTDQFSDRFPGDQWKLFDDFVRNKKPFLYFKREMLEGCSENVHPIDWPCFNEIPQLDTHYNRPVEVFFTWGHSNEARRRLHGEIFVNSTKKGYGVIDNPYNVERGMEEYHRKWVTLQIPHYTRLPMSQILFMQGHSKLSVSLPGAGLKCFRSCEASINSVMVMWEDGMKYSYDWVHGVNCIKANPGEEIEAIEAALQRVDLYDIYKNGVENVKKYYLPTYCKNYIEPIIKSHQ